MFRVSCIQLCSSENVEHNLNRTKQLIIKAVKQKSHFILTPEVSSKISLNKKKLLNTATSMDKDFYLNGIRVLAKKYKKWILIGSLILKVSKSRLVNRSILINSSGKIQSVYNKINLFDVNVNSRETHRESHSFIKGNKIVITKVNGVKIGLTICYDLRFPNLYRKLAKKNAKVILIPAAFTVPTGKVHWETLVRARAIENSVFIVATNMCGTHHSGRKTYGHSLLFDPWGNKENAGFTKTKILNTEINLDKIVKVRKKIPSILNT